ncbi:hypothetical protein V8D89_012095 [Ganoderma adspersum]
MSPPSKHLPLPLPPRNEGSVSGGPRPRFHILAAKSCPRRRVRPPSISILVARGLLTNPRGTSAGPSNGDLATLQQRLQLIFSDLPINLLPPIEDEPTLGSTEELKLFYMICIQFIPRPEEVHRSIIGGKIYGKAATTAMEVLRCPLNVRSVTFLMAKLVALYVVVLLNDFGPFEEAPIEYLKSQALVHLKSRSKIEFAWLDILIRLCGDFPELWHPSDAASLQTPQSMPIELPDSSSFDVAQDEVTSAGPSAIFDNDFDLLQPPFSQSVSNPAPFASQDSSGFSPSLPYPALSNPALAAFESESASFHSLPFTLLSEPVFNVYDSDFSVSHSLPNLPVGTSGQGTDVGGAGGSWSGYNFSSEHNQNGPLSGSNSVNYANLQNGLHPSVPMTGVPSTPSDASQSVATPGVVRDGLHGPISSLHDSTASDTSLVSTDHSLPQVYMDASTRSSGSASLQSQTSETRDAILVEGAKARTLANQTTLIRTQINFLEEYSQLFHANERFYHDRVHRLLLFNFLDIPYPDERKAALGPGADEMARGLAGLHDKWLQNIQPSLRMSVL